MALAPKNTHHVSDIHKGAFEGDASRGADDADETNTSMSGQEGHRNLPEELQGTDTDFPEPDASGEHSGQHK
jgi:hypothetical protein